MRVSTLHDFHTQAVAKAMLPSDKPRLTATTPPAFEVDASKVEEAFDAAYEASIGAKGNLGQKGDPSVSTVLVVALDKSILRPGESADFTYRYELLSYDTGNSNTTRVLVYSAWGSRSWYQYTPISADSHPPI